MKVPSDPGLPAVGGVDYERQLNFQLYDVLRQHAAQLNGLAEGSIYSFFSSTAAPTTGTYQRGDIVRNSEPSELGSASSKYVITGWICTVAGSPGTWVEMRSLTGN